MTGRGVLVFGYGNPGRRDDGLGPAAAAQIEAAGRHGVTIASNYQLGPEDAALVAEHSCVFFIDAGKDSEEPFSVRLIVPARTALFTTHALQPETVLALSREAFGSAPPAWSVVIRGYDFEIGDKISRRALGNLRAAVKLIQWRVNRWENRHAS